MSSKPIVVVGTTTDYIDLIRDQHPDRAIFITDADQRAKSREPRPGMQEEVLCDLRNTGKVIAALKAHLHRWKMQPAGIACFDFCSFESSAFITFIAALNSFFSL